MIEIAFVLFLIFAPLIPLFLYEINAQQRHDAAYRRRVAEEICSVDRRITWNS